MQYLTKSFHTKFRFDIDQHKLDTKGCINKLNKWLSKPDQQDVKVDDFNFATEYSNNKNSIMIKDDDNNTYQYSTMYRTRLVIIYHHE